MNGIPNDPGGSLSDAFHRLVMTRNNKGSRKREKRREMVTIMLLEMEESMRWFFYIGAYHCPYLFESIVCNGRGIL